MAAEWHYSKEGQQHGPVSAADLKALAKSGGLLPTDMIWKEGMAEWKPARSLKGLMSQAPPPSPAQPTKHTAQINSGIGIEQKKDQERFCRNCGQPGLKHAVACLSCGVDPNNGNAFCPDCGAASNAGAIICVKCGIGFKGNLSGRKNIGSTIASPKDPILMGVLSFLLPPLGQFLIGQTTKALVIFLTAPFVVLGFLFFTFGFGVFFIPVYPILMAADAYFLAKRIQEGGTVGEWEFAVMPSSHGIEVTQKSKAKPTSQPDVKATPVLEPKPNGLIPSLVAMTIIASLALLFGVFGFFELGPSGLHDLTGFSVCIGIGYNAIVIAMLWVSNAQKKHSMIVIANRLVFACWVPFFLTRVPLGVTMMGCMLSVAAAAWGHFVIQRDDVKDYFNRKKSA